MNVVRFDPRRQSTNTGNQAGRVTPVIGVVALVAVSALGWAVVDRFLPSGPTTAPGPTVVAEEIAAKFSMCGRDRFTCVVDGDTIWWRGQNLRLQSYDTPNRMTAFAAAMPRSRSPIAPVPACFSCSTPTPSLWRPSASTAPVAEPWPRSASLARMWGHPDRRGARAPLAGWRRVLVLRAFREARSRASWRLGDFDGRSGQAGRGLGQSG